MATNPTTTTSITIGDVIRPVCQCYHNSGDYDIPAIRRVSQKDNQNRNRPFWTCATGKCHFFQAIDNLPWFPRGHTVSQTYPDPETLLEPEDVVTIRSAITTANEKHFLRSNAYEKLADLRAFLAYCIEHKLTYTMNSLCQQLDGRLAIRNASTFGMRTLNADGIKIVGALISKQSATEIVHERPSRSRNVVQALLIDFKAKVPFFLKHYRVHLIPEGVALPLDTVEQCDMSIYITRISDDTFAIGTKDQSSWVGATFDSTTNTIRCDKAPAVDMGYYISFINNLATCDPAGVFGATGKRLGCCVFCGRTLTDPFSIEHGYGPICARYVKPLAK